MVNNRFLIIKTGCRHCREMMRTIEWINMKLPTQKRIKIFDNYQWENFGIMRHRVANKFTEEDGFSGYPFLMIDSVVIEPCQKEILEPFLKSFLAEDFII